MKEGRYKVIEMFDGGYMLDRLHEIGFKEPVVTKEFRSRTPKTKIARDALFGVARLSGVIAVIIGEEKVVAFGVQSAIDTMAWPVKPYGETRDEAELCVEEFPWFQQEQRDDRLSAIRVAHAVANTYPELRIWPDEDEHDPNGPEVQLRNRAGNLRVGGYALRALGGPLQGREPVTRGLAP